MLFVSNSFLLYIFIYKYIYRSVSFSIQFYNKEHNTCYWFISLMSYYILFFSFLTQMKKKRRDSNLVDSASSIRLSQRLSHACLSINKSILWNCEWLIISVIVYLMVFATWITVVILELIHASNPNLRRGVFIRWKPMQGNLDSGDS